MSTTRKAHVMELLGQVVVQGTGYRNTRAPRDVVPGRVREAARAPRRLTPSFLIWEYYRVQGTGLRENIPHEGK